MSTQSITHTHSKICLSQELLMNCEHLNAQQIFLRENTESNQRVQKIGINQGSFKNRFFWLPLNYVLGSQVQ